MKLCDERRNLESTLKAEELAGSITHLIDLEDYKLKGIYFYIEWNEWERIEVLLTDDEDQ